MTELFKNKYRIQTTRAPWWDYGYNGTYFITICTSNHEHYFGKIMQGEMQLTSIGRQAVHCWMKIPEHFSFVKLDAFVVMPNHIHGIIIIDKSELTDKSSNAMGDDAIGDDAIGDDAIGDDAIGDDAIGDDAIGDDAIGDDAIGDDAIGDDAIGDDAIGDDAIGDDAIGDDAIGDDAIGDDAIGDDAIVETQYIASLQQQQQQQQQYNMRQTKSKNNFGPQANNLASIIRGYKIGVTLHCKKNKILFGWQPRFHDHIIRDDNELNRIRGYIINNPFNWTDDEHYLL